MNGRLVIGFLAASLVTQEASAQDAAPTLRIEDAVQLALSRNERAKISDLNVTVASAAVARAVSPFLPTASFNANATQRPDDIVRQGQPSTIGTASVTVTQPLLNAAAIPLFAQARQNLEAQKAQTVDDKRLLAFDVTRAFFAALSADAVLIAAQRKLDTSPANLADARARADAQLASTNDATRALIDLAASEREVELDRGSQKATYIQLAYTINAPPPSGLTVPAAVLRAGREPVPRLESLLGVALNHRPDLAAKSHLAAAAHDSAREPLLRLVPVLGLSGSFSATTNTAAATAGGTTPHWNDEFLQATLSWPIYDAGIRYADRRSRDALANIADLTTAQLSRTVDAEVRSAVVALEASQAALTASEQAMNAARQSADETAILYHQGLAKAIELVDANNQRFIAEVNYSTAEYSTALAYLALRQALGLDPFGTELK